MTLAPTRAFASAAAIALAATIALWPVRGEGCAPGYFPGDLHLPPGGSSETTSRTLPALELERVALFHDAEAGREHLVQEIRYRAGDGGFALIVPVPAKPEVAAVKYPPFDNLRAKFPLVRVSDFGIGLGGSLDGSHGLGHGAGIGLGGGAAATEPAVPTVRASREFRVGKLEAVVLEADDGAALVDWLRREGYQLSEGAGPWLTRHVALGFSFVALELTTGAIGDETAGGDVADGTERPASDAEAARLGVVRSETIRISFDTPVPYFPYEEPAAPALPALEDGEPRARGVELWLVTNRPAVPICAWDHDGGSELVRPFHAGLRHEEARDGVLAMLHDDLDALVPPGTVTVQTFGDLKTDRAGYGDVLFAPEAPTLLDDARRDALEQFVPLLVAGSGPIGDPSR